MLSSFADPPDNGEAKNLLLISYIISTIMLKNYNFLFGIRTLCNLKNDFYQLIPGYS